MSTGRVLCQVVETPVEAAHHGRWMPARAEWPRDLLPWADPYIAVLMQRLEQRYEWAFVADDFSAADSPSGAEEGPPDSADDAWLYELWQDDAFMPGWQAWRRPMFPPMYGGFPLLDDLTDDDVSRGLEEDPL